MDTGNVLDRSNKSSVPIGLQNVMVRYGSDPILWKHSSNIMLEFNSLKKSIKVDFNRSRISLLYFYNAYVNLCEKKKNSAEVQLYSYRTNAFI